MKSLALPSLVVALFALSACATAEYQQAAGECRGEAMKSYPVVLEQRMFRRSREVMVPDGSTVCESTEMQQTTKNTGMTKTTSVCRPGMRKAIEYYDEPGTVDVNEGGREQFVSGCAANRCMQQFGNPKCKK